MSDPYRDNVEREAKSAMWAGQATHHDPSVRQRMGEMMGGSAVFEPSTEASASTNEGAGLVAFIVLAAIAGVFAFIDGAGSLALAVIVAFSMLCVPSIGFAFFGIAQTGLFAGLVNGDAYWHRDYWFNLAIPLVIAVVLGLAHFWLRGWRPYRTFNAAARTIYVYGALIWLFGWFAGQMNWLGNILKLLMSAKMDATHVINVVAGPFRAAFLLPYRTIVGTASPATLVPLLLATATMAAFLVFLFRKRLFARLAK